MEENIKNKRMKYVYFFTKIACEISVSNGQQYDGSSDFWKRAIKMRPFVVRAYEIKIINMYRENEKERYETQKQKKNLNAKHRDKFWADTAARGMLANIHRINRKLAWRFSQWNSIQ